ncbi:MAG: DMT family transporter [Coriobacteriia bacterium]|nr:DMT family transporter [Coriobacteriia bacterium]
MMAKLKSADRQVVAVVALIFVATVWGATFVVVADAITQYPVYAFLCLRFAIAALAFLAFFPKVLKRIDVHNLKLGIPAGILLSAGYILQTLGLLPLSQGGTTPARTAFLTGMYVVLVPVAQSIIRKRMPHRGTIVGVGLALSGLVLLSGITLSGTHGWVLGDTLVLASAFAYAAHMILLGTNDKHHDTLALTFVQLAVVALTTGAMSLATGEHAGLPTSPNVWFALLTCGLVASAFAFVVQTWAQRILPPSRIALILISEPALGGLFGWWMAGLAPTREVIGAALMLAGMITSELMASRQAHMQAQRLKRAVEGMPVFTDDPNRNKRVPSKSDE